jgi:hypothetical protein
MTGHLLFMLRAGGVLIFFVMILCGAVLGKEMESKEHYCVKDRPIGKFSAIF